MIDVVEDELAWFEDAACRGIAIENGNHDLFFGRQTVTRRSRVTYCAQCPVALKCILFAEANEIVDGTWGGLEERERRRFRRLYGSVSSPVGRAAYERHLRKLRETVPKGTADGDHRRLGLRPGRQGHDRRDPRP